jgi:hypothetical protein
MNRIDRIAGTIAVGILIIAAIVLGYFFLYSANLNIAKHAVETTSFKITGSTTDDEIVKHLPIVLTQTIQNNKAVKVILRYDIVLYWPYSHEVYISENVPLYIYSDISGSNFIKVFRDDGTVTVYSGFPWKGKESKITKVIE